MGLCGAIKRCKTRHEGVRTVRWLGMPDMITGSIIWLRLLFLLLGLIVSIYELRMMVRN